MNISKKITIIIMFILSLSIALMGCANTKSPEEKLNAYMHQLYINDIDPAPSMSILVVDHGEVVYKKSFGYANVETLEKANPNTNYRLASVTKMFTAMCAIILKDRGLLDYDTKVSDILEDFPEYGKDITVRHLITHTSGLQDFYGLADLLDESFDENNQILDSDVYEIVKRANSTNFPPGAAFQYSDTGYIVLGLIVEKVSGVELSEYMYENIFEPLKMYNTVAFDKTLNMEIKNRAYGAELDGTKFITKDQSYSSATLGDGGVYSSLEDLYKWDQALYSDILVSKDTLKEAYTPPRSVDLLGNNEYYTAGWCFEKDDRGELMQFHNGASQGFSTFYIRMPEQKRAIIVLSNKNEDNRAYELHEYIRKIYDFDK